MSLFEKMNTKFRSIEMIAVVALVAELLRFCRLDEVLYTEFLSKADHA